VVDYAVGESGLMQAAVGAGQVGVTLLGLSYSREQERQADRVGTYYMALAGWDPQQSIAMQSLLDSLSQGEGSVLDRYLSTHPGAGDRISEIEAVIEQKDLESRYLEGDGVFADRWRRRLEQLRAVDRAFEPYDRGMKALENSQFADALSAADEAIQIREDQAQFYRLRGDALLGLNRIDEAKRAYQTSLERDPRYVLANIGLGRAYLAEGNNEAAEREFAKAAEDFPGATMPRAGLGLASYRKGDYQAAVGPLSSVAASAPESPQVHYMLADSYERTGQPRKALRSYRDALAAGLSGQKRSRALRRIQALGGAAEQP
jgi:predicted Zn-dependent protease